MTRPARLVYVGVTVLVSVLAICLLLFALYLLGPRSGPIALKVVRVGEDGSGSLIALVHLTNRTHANFNYVFWTEVLSNGVWVDALTQHQEARMANGLPPHHQRTLEVPVPREGTAWRIQLDAARVFGRFEMLLYNVGRRLKVPYPFAQELKVYSQTNEVITVPKPQGAANRSQPSNSETNPDPSGGPLPLLRLSTSCARGQTWSSEVELNPA